MRSGVYRTLETAYGYLINPTNEGPNMNATAEVTDLTSLYVVLRVTDAADEDAAVNAARDAYDAFDLFFAERNDDGTYDVTLLRD